MTATIYRYHISHHHLSATMYNHGLQLPHSHLWCLQGSKPCESMSAAPTYLRTLSVSDPELLFSFFRLVYSAIHCQWICLLYFPINTGYWRLARANNSRPGARMLLLYRMTHAPRRQPNSYLFGKDSPSIDGTGTCWNRCLWLSPSSSWFHLGSY